MQEKLFSPNVSNLRLLFERQKVLSNVKNQNKHDMTLNPQKKFIFRQHQTIQKQILNFKANQKSNQWNGKLAFADFKGAFKMEYWGKFEEALRQITDLKKLIFSETKLSKIHLRLLRSFIQWVDPKEISLKFFHNELDDEDLDEFLIQGLLPAFGHKIRSVQIISNPGIFKGHFISQLKKNLHQMTQTDKENNYHFVKNKEYRSIGFIRIPKITENSVEMSIILKLQISLQKTYFYKFSFYNCFTDVNQEAFQHLIESTYHEDQIEQIESIDVGGCNLGTQIIFDKLCKKISTSRGLLSLGLNGQIYLQKPDILYSLMGDRYDQLRINHIDIGNNEDIVEKGMKVLADNLFSKSIKTINLDGSLQKGQAVAGKMIQLTNAMINEIKFKEIILKKEKFIPKFTIKRLDLSTVDNQSSHDVARDFLLATVFNTFSDCKELIIQSLDFGRLNAYLQALDQFESHIIKLKQENLCCEKFTPKLTKIGMHKQIDKTDPKLMGDLYRRLFFTKSSDLLQIESVTIGNSFWNSEREIVLENFLKSLTNEYQQLPDIKYTMKHFTMIDSEANEGRILSLIFKNILFCNHFNIESFILNNEIFTDIEGDQFLICAGLFLQTIPVGNYCALTILILDNLSGGGVDPLKLVELLVFSNKVRILELQLTKFRLQNDDVSITSLKNKADGWNEKLTLKKLQLGEFSNSDNNIECTLIESLIIHPMSIISALSLQSIVFSKESLDQLKVRMMTEQKLGHTPMIFLKSLSLDDFDDYSQDQWEIIGDIFLFAKDTSIHNIQFKNMKITPAMIQGLDKSITRKQEYLINENVLNLGSYFSIKVLRLDTCDFLDDIFSLIFLTQQESLQILQIENCTNLDKALYSLKLTFETNEELSNIVRYQIQDFLLDGTILESEELFEWFFRNIIFNTKTQQLKRLSLRGCRLNNLNFEVLNKLLQEIKNFQLSERQQSYFCINEIILDDNEEIKYGHWKDFFDILITPINGQKDDLREIDAEVVEIKLKNVDQASQEKIDTKIKKCESITQFIVEKRLSIPNKILTNPKIYCINPPIQLNRLDLNMQFADETQTVKQRLYNRILKGLVFFPKSELKELNLTHVDLPLFIASSQESFQSLAIYDKNKIASLKQLKISTIQNETQENLGVFAELYILNRQIHLEAFIIDSVKTGNLYQNIAECIEKSLIGGQICTLNLLSLKETHSILDVDQTLHFFKTIVFNKQVPLSSVDFGKDLTLQSDDNFLQLIGAHIIKQNYSCPLKQFFISTKVVDKNEDTFIRLLPLLVEGVLIKLQRLTFIDANDAPLELFEKFVDQKKLLSFSIIDLHLDYHMYMNLSEFKFLYYVRPKLQSLYLSRLSTKFNGVNEINDFLLTIKNSITIMQRFKTKSTIKLQFKYDGGQQKQLMEKFVFGPAFKWDVVTLTGQELYTYLQDTSYSDSCLLGGSLTRHLMSLKLNSKRDQSSLSQMNQNCLRIIGEQLIYNEKSMLKELCLISCNLKPYGLTALTSGAQAFREKIQQRNEQSITHLSLKRFQIYNSLNILDEGAELINKDIFFFEYISIEQIEVVLCQWNDNMSISHCNHGLAWIQFQKQNNRKQHHFFLKLVDFGQNEFVHSQKAWWLLCDTFIFSEKTPNLEVLNINQMGLKDEQIDWICKKADDYFRWKPYNYIIYHPLKRLNFQGNTALTSVGWTEVTNRFFFAQLVNLLELNLTQTMLDSQEKLDAIFLGAHKKALEHKSKKVPLHTILTQNISLKQKFQEIISYRPENFESLNDYAIQCYSSGVIDEIPESFGQTTSIITKTLYQADRITINDNIWNQQNKMRFSEYHLDIASGFLGPLSEFFNKTSEYCSHIPIDLTTCDELCTIFKYKQTVGDPYPYQLFFTDEACQFYEKRACTVRVINFLTTNHKNSETVDQFQVFELWKLVRSPKTSLDIVYIDYRLDDDLVEAMFRQSYTERDIVNLVRLFPPSQLRFQNTLTLQALKAIYSVMYDNYQFKYANILYDKDIFFNVGIGYSFREFVYGSNPTSIIGRCMKSVFYNILDLFVSEVPKYSFTDQIKELNDFLQTQRKYFFILTVITILFYIICLFGPYGFQHYYGQGGDVNYDIVCYNGLSPIGIYCFLVFAFFSFLAEAYLYWGISQIIPNHIVGLINTSEQNDLETEIVMKTNKNYVAKQSYQQVVPFVNKNMFQQEEKKSPSKRLDLKQDEKINLMSSREDITSAGHVNTKSHLDKFPSLGYFRQLFGLNKLIAKLSNFSKTKNGRVLGYVKDLTIGQLAKLHLYTNVNFIMTCYYCRLNNLALLALIVTATNVTLQSYPPIKFIITQYFKNYRKAKLISTHYINNFFEITSLGRNVALSTILDTVAPFNVTACINNRFTRFFYPQIAGKMMSNSARIHIMKFALEDVPQLILQLYFVIYRALNPLSDPSQKGTNAVALKTGSLSVTIYITIITTCVSLILSFISFMSIRPSSISQADFDELAKKKSKSYLTNQLTFLDKEFEILQALTGDTALSRTNKDDDEELISV